MRKRRRLANKMIIMVCAVLCAVSAFFYAPMEVRAEESSNVSLISIDDYNFSSGDISQAVPDKYYRYIAPFRLFEDSSFDFSQFLNDGDGFYKVTFDITVNMSADSVEPPWWIDSVFYYSVSGFNYQISQWSSWNTFSDFSFSYDNVQIIVDSSDCLMTSRYGSVPMWANALSSVNVTCSYDLSDIKVEKLSSFDSDEYQRGYNAGYSAGESAGYDNGYSNGFVDGEESVDTGVIYDEAFQAGKDSVDTQSYYDAGYQAGYDAAYSAGYESGYDEGLKSARESKGEWGKYIYLKPMQNVTRVGNPFYVSSYALLDMEEYQSGANGYFRNTVPGTYQGETTISYHIPLYTLNNNLPLKIDSDSLNVRFEVLGIRPVLDCNLGGATVRANLFNSKIQEIYVLYNGQKYYGNYDSGTSYADFNFMISGLSGDKLLSNWDMTLCFVLQNTVTLVTNEDVSRFVSAEYTPNISFELGRETSNNAVTLRLYYSNDRVSANIQNQTEQLMYGFDESQGNSVNSDLSTGLNEYQTAEDSLWATATTGLKDFTFFDFESVPAMITGMSFITSIMGKWFNEAGGASGVGIVLSILFSVMLVSMVLGLYRLYQSAGHRAEARQRHAERMQHWKKGK